MAPAMRSGSEKLVSATMAISGWRWWMAAIAVGPSISGMTRSIRITSGWSR